ncbi:MAG: polysaccharide deacetylase family protein [Planctomycetota bacterium]
MRENVLALRMDDVGASSKRYEVYSDREWGVGPFRVSANWLWLKYLPGLRGWGVYRELTGKDWKALLAILERFGARLTVAITATWVENERRQVPFPEKFPGEAAMIKSGVASGLLEIANHGLTHCVAEKDVFKPRWFDGNRKWHREFWDWIPGEVQHEHIRRAQDILQGYFGTDVVTFVPPGNVFGDATVAAARACGIRYISCQATPRRENGMTIVGNEGIVPFHDRDIVMNGTQLLERKIRELTGREFVFVREAGRRYSEGVVA